MRENKNMKDFNKYLNEKVKPITFENLKHKHILLSEADDDFDMDDGGGDPFGDDDGGDDPFGDDDGGGDPFGDDDGGFGGGPDNDGNSDDGEGSDGEKESYNLDEYEDDPDWTQGTVDTDDIVSPKTSAEAVYDVEGVLNAINTTVEALPEEELAEIEKVKRAIELIFNGKILKADDVIFSNSKNASYLIRKIGEKIDERTRNYMLIKIKTPLIKQRNLNKKEIADIKNDVEEIRGTLADLK